MTPLALDLNDLFLFSQVVQRQGFSAAARMLGLPKSAFRAGSVCWKKDWKRACCSVTRALCLTDAGEALYLHCLAMLAEAQAVKPPYAAPAEPSGQVRLSVPIAIADAVCCRACCLLSCSATPRSDWLCRPVTARWICWKRAWMWWCVVLALHLPAWCRFPVYRPVGFAGHAMAGIGGVPAATAGGHDSLMFGPLEGR
jgi:hypothetical protein